jgi:NAD-dependent SIR2 family protein deacetylase
VQEQVITLEGSVSMLRCLYCGEQIDQVIMANRNHSEISQDGRCAGVDAVFSEWKNATTEKRMYTAQ